MLFVCNIDNVDIISYLHCLYYIETPYIDLCQTYRIIHLKMYGLLLLNMQEYVEKVFGVKKWIEIRDSLKIKVKTNQPFVNAVQAIHTKGFQWCVCMCVCACVCVCVLVSCMK